VRHPICAGFSLALLGTAIAIGEIRGLLAFVAAFIGMKLKSAQEENFMKQRFGEEYIQYSCEVKSIVPCIW
jgi:protein-S-isoprenylcysteine O-methyltransferase Ste14